MTFGNALARLRRDRGWSQEALALRAGLSQRHVSFLETGRAKPGERSLRQLVAALALRGWEQRSLLTTLAPAASLDLVPTHEPALIVELVERLSPWPTYAYRPEGSLVAVNRAMQHLLTRAASDEDLWQATAPPIGPNVYDLALHPDGLTRFMVNPEEVVPETLRRLRIEAAVDPALYVVIGRLEAYPAARAAAAASSVPPPVLVERYALGDNMLSVISIVSHLASPGEFDLAALRIETFVPADATSEAILTAP
jgi:transcriptional regulator with XRE-family HTH domain